MCIEFFFFFYELWFLDRFFFSSIVVSYDFYERKRIKFPAQSQFRDIFPLQYLQRGELPKWLSLHTVLILKLALNCYRTAISPNNFWAMENVGYTMFKWKHSKWNWAPLIWYIVWYINPFVPNAPFLYPLRTLEILMVFWCFQGVENRCIGNKWVKLVY